MLFPFNRGRNRLDVTTDTKTSSRYDSQMLFPFNRGRNRLDADSPFSAPPQTDFSPSTEVATDWMLLLFKLLSCLVSRPSLRGTP